MSSKFYCETDCQIAGKKYRAPHAGCGADVIIISDTDLQTQIDLGIHPSTKNPISGVFNHFVPGEISAAMRGAVNDFLAVIKKAKGGAEPEETAAAPVAAPETEEAPEAEATNSLNTMANPDAIALVNGCESVEELERLWPEADVEQLKKGIAKAYTEKMKSLKFLGRE